jgi:hypothetical protein
VHVSGKALKPPDQPYHHRFRTYIHYNTKPPYYTKREGRALSAKSTQRRDFKKVRDVKQIAGL